MSEELSTNGASFQRLTAQGGTQKVKSCVWLGILMAVLTWVPSVVSAGDPALEEAWRNRNTASGSQEAIAIWRAASQGKEASPLIFERLGRLRFAHVERFVSEGSPERRIQYEACVADGLRGLRLFGGMGEGPTTMAEVDEGRSRIPPAATGILYWTTLCYGNTIPRLPLLQQAGAALRFRRLLERLVALDGGYFHGGPHRVLAEFLHKAPALMGGSEAKAAVHADLAIQSDRKFAENWLCRAEYVFQPAGEMGKFQADLASAIQAARHVVPDAAHEQKRAEERAKKLQRGGGR